MNLSSMSPMLITFIVYTLGMIVIGFVASFATKNFDDYILGGRRLGSFVTALSAGASDMSGWLLMGLPGAIYALGLSQAWIAVGLTAGAWLNWKLVAGRLRIQTEVNHNALTLPDYFGNRFEDKKHLLRVISAIIILSFLTVYCASGVVAGARLFQTTFGLSYYPALFAGAAATILYTYIGGFLAISWTDTIQASLMVFALVFTPIAIVLSCGGFSHTVDTIALQFPDRSNLIPEGSAIAIISALGWGLGYFGQPHILTRFMASDSHHSIKKATRLSMTWMIFCLVGALSIGYFGIAYFLQNPSQALGVSQNNEKVFIEIAVLLFNPWISGILLSAILAAVMSTLSCQLLVCSSAITEDLYKYYLRPHASQKELMIVSKIMVLTTAFIAIMLAFNPNNSVLNLVSYAWGGFGAAFGPVVLISLFWKRMTNKGAVAGMIVGALTIFIWKHFNFFHLYEIIPGFIFASFTIFIVSLLDKQPTVSMIEKFEKAERIWNKDPNDQGNEVYSLVGNEKA